MAKETNLTEYSYSDDNPAGAIVGDIAQASLWTTCTLLETLSRLPKAVGTGLVSGGVAAGAAYGIAAAAKASAVTAVATTMTVSFGCCLFGCVTCLAAPCICDGKKNENKQERQEEKTPLTQQMRKE